MQATKAHRSTHNARIMLACLLQQHFSLIWSKPHAHAQRGVRTRHMPGCPNHRSLVTAPLASATLAGKVSPVGAVISPVGALSDCPHKLYVARWHADKHVSPGASLTSARAMQRGAGHSHARCQVRRGPTETEGLGYYHMTPCYGHTQSSVGTLLSGLLGGPRHSREENTTAAKETPACPTHSKVHRDCAHMPHLSRWPSDRHTCHALAHLCSMGLGRPNALPTDTAPDSNAELSLHGA